MTASSDRARQDEDHDLLTFGEVGVRLREAIDEQRQLIADLSDADPDALADARHRLDALIAAAERNRPGDASSTRFAQSPR